VRSSKAKSGDKIGIHDILIEVQKVPDSWANRFRQGQAQQYGMPPHGGGYYAGAANGAAYQQIPGAQGTPVEDLPPEVQASAMQDLLQGRLPTWAQGMNNYMERVVLPGVYQLPEMFEFKWVLAGMMALFILMVTALSTIPLIHILKASIEEESQQHAMTIATTLARVNIPALNQGLDSSVSVEIATSRPGVSKALVISNVDGNVIAPASQAGTYPDIPYVNEGRKLDKESVHQVNDNTIVAMYPVRFYNSDTGAQAIMAWAVV
jgi:hypothetical protein